MNEIKQEPRFSGDEMVIACFPFPWQTVFIANSSLQGVLFVCGTDTQCVASAVLDVSWFVKADEDQWTDMQ